MKHKVAWTQTLLVGLAFSSVSIGPNTPSAGIVLGDTAEASWGRAIRDTALAPARTSNIADTKEFSTQKTELTVSVTGRSAPYRYMAVTTLPNEPVEIQASSVTGNPLTIRFAAGDLVSAAAGVWAWTAPNAPGIYALRIDGEDGDFVHLNVLVMHPHAKVVDGQLNGYAIGAYRSTPLRGNPVYLPPAGFVEVHSEDYDVLLSPHFTLRQFLCKQPGSPQYVALSHPLLLKLEAVLEAVNAEGIETQTFNVMSGFRTPAYNRSIGNRTSYSRHLWGDAADIFIDVDGNGVMDDLDGDGVSNRNDATALARIVDAVEAGDAPNVNDGGVGIYRANSVHGPFVHVDARGYRARW